MNTYLLFMLTEIRKDKIKLIKDPIKRMSYNGSGSAREVVRMIALALSLKIQPLYLLLVDYQYFTP